MAVVALDVFEEAVFEDGIFSDFTSDFVDRLDVTNKVVFIKDTVTTFHPVDDMYSEVRSIRRVDESVRVMNNPVSSQGNEPAGANFTPRRAVLNDGWRLGLEYQSNWNLSITGEMISDDGFAGAQLVKLDYLPAGVSALINYTPPSSEVIVVTSGSGLSAEESTKLLSIPTEAETAVAVWNEDTRTLTQQVGITEQDKDDIASKSATATLDQIL